MSWNDIEIEDLLIKETLRALPMDWVCPRCDCVQTSPVSIAGLLYGKAIKCKNTKVCGDGQSHFTLRLSVDGCYKGLADRPLDKIEENKDNE